MKGVITNIKRMAVHDGHGLRTTVFFKGCPLRCIWCHNPDTLFFKPQLAFHKSKCVSCGACFEVCTNGVFDGKKYDSERCISCFKCADVCPVSAKERYGEEWEAEKLAEHLLCDRPFFEASGGGVTFSGGECLAQIDFLEELARLLHKEGISVDIDTSGYAPFSSFERIIPYTDEFLYDIKTFDSELHKRLTGKDNKIIIENLRRLDSLGSRVEIRYPYVPGYNDCECRAIGELLLSLKSVRRIKVLGYHSLAKSKYNSLGMDYKIDAKDATSDDVQTAVDLLLSMGLEAINGMLDD